MGKVCYLIDPEEMLQAAQRGDVAKVRQLLASDTTLVNAKGAHDKTPLHWAAEKNYPELAELLLSAGHRVWVFQTGVAQPPSAVFLFFPQPFVILGPRDEPFPHRILADIFNFLFQTFRVPYDMIERFILPHRSRPLKSFIH